MRSWLPSPTYLNILLILEIGLHFILPVRRMIYSPYTYLGFVPILLSAGLNIWAVRLLNEKNTTIDFHGRPHDLVIDGPFRINRNPIYISGVILSLGVAMLFGSLITFVFPIALLLILDRFYIPSEEVILEKTFGKRYLDYKQKVRRWL